MVLVRVCFPPKVSPFLFCEGGCCWFLQVCVLFGGVYVSQRLRYTLQTGEADLVRIVSACCCCICVVASLRKVLLLGVCVPCGADSVLIHHSC